MRTLLNHYIETLIKLKHYGTTSYDLLNVTESIINEYGYEIKGKIWQVKNIGQGQLKYFRKTFNISVQNSNEIFPITYNYQVGNQSSVSVDAEEFSWMYAALDEALETYINNWNNNPGIPFEEVEQYANYC